MTNKSLWQKYKDLLKKADFIVTYKALPDEIDPNQLPCCEIIKNKPNFTVPQTHKIAPTKVARDILDFTKNYSLSPTPYTLVYLPGQKFDLYGTRYGRGFGWYDKLLSFLPDKWIRIGVADEKQVSKEKLERQEWDQPVDWLIYKTANNLWIIKEIKSST